MAKKTVMHINLLFFLDFIPPSFGFLPLSLLKFYA